MKLFSKAVVVDNENAPAPRKRGFRPNWRMLGGLVLATLFAAAAAFLFWQAYLLLGEQRAIDAAEASRNQSVKVVAESIGKVRSRIDAAMSSERIREQLENPSADLNQITLTLRELVPELDLAEFYSVDLQPVVSGDLAKLGYSRASLLARSQATQDATVALLRRFSGKPALVQAMPAKAADGSVRAYALLRWSAQPVIDAFSQVGSPTRLELRQGSSDGDDEIIQAIGPDLTGTIRDIGKPIAGSQMRIYTAPPSLPIFVPREPILVLLLAVLALLGAIVALWVRSVGARQALGRFRGGARTSEPRDQTLNDLIHQNVIAGAGVRTIPSVQTVRKPEPDVIDVSAAMFRTYDIRGVVGAGLSAGVAELLGRAIGSEARERGLGEIVVGRDGRLSGPELSAALIAGIRATGTDVIDIGLAPTPLVYFAGFHLNTGSGVAVTGSHNPPDYNGFKIVLGGETLSGDAIIALHTRIVERRFSEGEGGLQVMDIGSAYVDRIAGDIQVQRRLKVVIDAGNGVAGALAPDVLENIGCDVVPLFCDVDGTFPNHHPDPSDPHNLQDLIAMVKTTDADIGLAFDGDGDRLGVVTRSGEVIYPDRLLMLFAADVLSRNPGSMIIYDVKCTGKLGPDIARHGGLPLMWKTGHSLIKAKMRETDAQLAGEMSGHFFFKERWYGFDDGIYAAARLLEILANDPRPAQKVFDELPKGESTPELNIKMQEGETHAFVDAFQKKASFDGARITTIDGVRADWSDGWGLVRASNTTPVLVLRFDADNSAALKRIQDQFRRQLLALSPRMKLPF